MPPTHYLSKPGGGGGAGGGRIQGPGLAAPPGSDITHIIMVCPTHNMPLGIPLIGYLALAHLQHG